MTINTIDESQRNLLVGILILKVRVAHHVIVTKRVRGTLYGSMNPMNTACAAIFLVLGFFPAYCQNSPAPEFEVASVKLASHPSSAYEEGFRRGRASQGIIVQGNRVTITDHSLKDLVRLAYREDGEIAGDAQTKEPFVRHDVPRRLRGIVEGDELGAYIELGEDRRRQRKQIRESHKCRCFAL